MNIDIDRLTEDQLVDINNRIVQRLRFLDQMRAHSQMLEFKIGDRVMFNPDNRGPVTGMLTRYNKKTVTIITESGQKWTVSPMLISIVVTPATDTVLKNQMLKLPSK
ncbi:MAG: hypothetical protein JKX85_13520 [Phycisphaeraceae bacterium]|nr:hypothetical protein [Phycisphaeraceae bacterium]